MDNLSQTDVILLKCHFIPSNFRRDAWRIFSHLGHTDPSTVNKMVLPSTYRQRWRHIHAFIGRNTIALRVQRFAAGANVICLTYATDWWADIGPVIHGESKSQATRSSLDHVGLLHTLSTIDTQVSKLGVRLVLEVLAKLMVGENLSWEFPKVGVRLILEVHLILETRRYWIFVRKHRYVLIVFAFLCHSSLQ